MAKTISIPPDVVTSTDFVFMNPSTQALYFHLLINADAAGRVYNAPVIARMIGVNGDDIGELIERGFLNDSGSFCTLTGWQSKCEAVA